MPPAETRGAEPQQGLAEASVTISMPAACPAAPLNGYR